MLRVLLALGAHKRSRAASTPAGCTVERVITVSAAPGHCATDLALLRQPELSPRSGDRKPRRQSSMRHAASRRCLIVNNNWTHVMINEMGRHRAASESTVTAAPLRKELFDTTTTQSARKCAHGVIAWLNGRHVVSSADEPGAGISRSRSGIPGRGSHVASHRPSYPHPGLR